MKGYISKISGPTIHAEIQGLKLYELVFIGKKKLIGEVVKLEKNKAIIQIYEETKGLSIGETVTASGKQLSVTLGPGLLSQIYDGLQRPLEKIKIQTGNFINISGIVDPIDFDKKWKITPTKKEGDNIKYGDILGFTYEGSFKHYITTPIGISGEIKMINTDSFSLRDSVCELKDGTKIYAFQHWPVRLQKHYKTKKAPLIPIITGQRILDFLFPLARGGCAIIPGGFGTGKTILEQTIAKFSDVDIVIYAGCGERGNEMADLLCEFKELKDHRSNEILLKRTVFIANTSNMPVAAREASIYTAVAIGEYYRDMGYNVLLLADSLSRWAEALREISSSLEEMPGEEGYPTYLASRLSSFIERAGTVTTLSGKEGSLSMILSVSPPGGDFTEPVTQALLRTTGCFYMLDSDLANSRHFPAINWFQSFSLYKDVLVKYFNEHISADWENIISRCVNILKKEDALREIIELVGHEGLQDSDRLLIACGDKIKADFLSQNAYSEDAYSSPENTFKTIKNFVVQYDDLVNKLNISKEK